MSRRDALALETSSLPGFARSRQKHARTAKAAGITLVAGGAVELEPHVHGCDVQLTPHAGAQHGQVQGDDRRGQLWMGGDIAAPRRTSRGSQNDHQASRSPAGSWQNGDRHSGEQEVARPRSLAR